VTTESGVGGRKSAFGVATGRDPRDADPPSGQRVAVESLVTILQRKLLAEGPAACIVDQDGQLLYKNRAYVRIADALANAASEPQAPRRPGANGRNGPSTPANALTLSVAGRTEHYHHSRHEFSVPPLQAVAHIYEEVTKSRALVSALGQATTRLDDMTRLVSDWVWETDADLIFTFVSPRIGDLLGYLPREIVGRHLTDLPRTGADALAKVAGKENRTPFRDVEVEIRDRTGAPHSFLLSGLPVYNTASGKFLGLRGTAKDVTDLNAREKALVQAKESAETANQSKTKFLSIMSHELRTPLNVVIGFSEMMEQEIKGPLGNDQYKGYAGDIRESARHLLKLIDDILDVAKVEAGGHVLDDELIDPYDLAESARRLVAERAKNAGQTLAMTLPPDLPNLRGDERKLKQVLLNLLSNAIKFTDRGGTIEISAELSADGGFAFQVSDSGIGISKEDLPRAFAPFEQVEHRLNREHTGTGLGVPLSRGFMKLHGGDLELESEPGVGTRAIARLPAERVV
jgi:PAS domain S-box-containing protein